MSDNKKYNGYNNYETWLIALWIDNDQYYQEQVQELAEQYSDDENGMSSALKDFVEEMPDVSKAIENGGMIVDEVTKSTYPVICAPSAYAKTKKITYLKAIVQTMIDDPDNIRPYVPVPNIGHNQVTVIQESVPA